VGLGGTAEALHPIKPKPGLLGAPAVPFPKPICETSSNPKVRILEPSGRVKPDRGQRCGCWQAAEKVQIATAAPKECAWELGRPRRSLPS